MDLTNNTTIKRIYFIFLSVLTVLLLLSRINLINSYSIDLDGVEFMFIHYIQNILYSKEMYTAMDQFPFDTSIHMPFYSILMAKIFQVLDLTKVGDIHHQLIICRSISLCFLFFCIYILIKIQWLFHKDRLTSLLIICFSMLFLTGHFYCARQDAIKTSFILLFIYSSLKFLEKERSAKYFILTILSGIIAINIKQDSIIYSYIFLSVILIVYRSRKSVILLLTFLITTLSSFFLLYCIYGYKFIENTVLLNFQINTSNSTSYNLLMFIFSLARSLPALFFLLYLHKNYFNDIKTNKKLQTIIYTSYAIYIAAHLLTFRASSYINYTHEAMLLIILSVAILGIDILQQKKVITGSILFSLLLILSNLVIHAYPLSLKNEPNNYALYQQNQANRNSIDTIIKNDITFFTTCNNTIFYPDKKLIYGYDLHIDRFIYTYLGLKTETRLLFIKSEQYDNYFKHGNVKYIIGNNNERDRKSIKEFYPDFTLYKKVNNLEVYRLQQ